MEYYSWVFSAYMLASTTTVPLFGKLSDIYGRRPIYAAAMALFLLGSLLCGLAQSIEQLIIFRAVQGLGAGGLLPLAFIIVGDLFTFEQRARMQGLFSGVWGVSSVIGPLLGGFLVDQVTWRWVFYVNIPFGLLAGALVWLAWVDRAPAHAATRPSVDYAGAALLTAGVVALLLGLFELGTPMQLGAAWPGRAAVCRAGLGRAARRRPGAAAAAIPRSDVRGGLRKRPAGRLGAVWQHHVCAAVCAGGAGHQRHGGGRHADAADARLGWRQHCRQPAAAAGGLPLARADRHEPADDRHAADDAERRQHQPAGPAGRPGPDGHRHGPDHPSFLIAVQSSVERKQMGTATSTLQFSRSIGGTLGVSVMGAALSFRLASALAAAGLDPNAVSVDELIDPLPTADPSAVLEGALRGALASAIQVVFIIALVAAALALAVTFFAPRGRIAQLAAQRSSAEGEQAAPSLTMSD